jgi:two-component system, sporulation sensor kinase E
MTRRRHSSLDRILGRLDGLDQANLAILVQRLARERDLLETVFDTVREGVLVTDAHGVVQYANRPGATLIGMKSADLGKAVLWKWAPDLARTLPLGLSGAVGYSAREIEVAYPEKRVLRVQISPLESPEDEEDDGRRFVIILMDVTEERASTEERIEDERMNSIRMLAAGVAHEIGNPLNSINIHLQLLERRLAKLGATPETGKLAESVAVCASEIRRLDDILKNFLDAIGPRTPDFSDVNLLQVVGEVLAIQREEMTNLGITVEMDLRADIPPVSGDFNQLKQVFFNILKNAMEAMDSGGLITLSAGSDDDFVTVSVRDTGAGMERDAVSRIFDPFFTTKAGGHGLGMMIVMRILRAHGAQIDVDSAPGQGTTVTLRFPQKHRRVRLLGSPV